MNPELDNTRIESAHESLDRLNSEIRKLFIGQEQLVEGMIVGLIARGNILLEGQPGLGKTLLVRVLSEALDLEFSRIQFTPDLMPADITGAQALVQTDGGGTELQFRKGPIFANIVLADEINRATPKTQSALLEAMQEHAVTVAGRRMALDQPFLVIATQNPVEMEGTYPLPEAQLDRFLLKLDVPFPSFEVLRDIGLRTTGATQDTVTAVLGREELIAIQDLAVQVVVAPEIADYAAHLTMATHPESSDAVADVKKFVRYGASPRAMQALIKAGRARALMEGRPWVSAGDIVAVARPILRHRMILGFDAEIEGVSSDDIVESVLKGVKRQAA